MFEYLLAGFTGSFFSYFVVFQLGGCFNECISQHSETNRRKYDTIIENKINKLDITFHHDMGCLMREVDKINNKIDKLSKSVDIEQKWVRELSLIRNPIKSGNDDDNVLLLEVQG